MIGCLLAAGYALLSGWGLPAQRTIWMLWLVSGLRLSGRQWPWPLVWMVALAVVGLMDPWALLQPGFWLSFVAVALLFLPHGLPPESISSTSGWIKEQVWGQLRISIALAPLGLFFFQQFSVAGLLANLVAVPWVTWVVTPLSLAGLVWAPAWDGAAWCVGVLQAGLQWLAVWPWAALERPQPGVVPAVLALLGAAWLVWPGPLHLRLLGLPCLLALLFAEPARPVPGQFDVSVADVGQGAAVVVRTARHALLYDTGPRYGPDSDAGQRVLVPMLRAMGVRPDRVVLSHRDSDHTGGWPSLQRWMGSVSLLSSMPGFGHSQRCVAGQQWQWDGVTFTVLHPDAQDYERSLKTNAMSCVVRVKAGEASLLLTGDIEQQQERWLIDRWGEAGLRSTVMLAPHHGSRTSSSVPWLRAVQPKGVIVQSGYRNRFGHPAAEVLQRYADLDIVVIRTDHCGAWYWIDGQPLDAQKQCYRALNQRYWRWARGVHTPNE